MRKFIACLLLGALLGMISPLLPAQQTQSRQKSDTGIEALEKRISELEKQLQTVENVEKMAVQAKLVETNAKLINADLDAFKNEVWVDNEERMRRWSHWFFGMLGIIVVISGGAVWLLLKSLIADGVEKNLSGFKKGVGQIEIMKDELRELEKKHVVSVLDRMFPNSKDYPLSEEINALREATLLQVLSDERYRMAHRCKAAEVLAYQKKSLQLISPTLEILNSFLNSDMDSYPKSFGVTFIKHLRQVPTSEVHQGLTKFLNRLLAGKPEDKDLFLTQTISSLADVGVKLNISDAVPILKAALPHLKDPEPAELQALGELARYFDIFNDSAGIKDILTNHVAGEMPNWESVRKSIENLCLELLQKYGSDFAEKR